MKYIVIKKAEVRPYTRTRKGKMERVTGYQAQRVKEYPPKPEGAELYQKDYGYEKPVKLGEWGWSTTFNKWGRSVEFEDGTKVFTYPKPESTVHTPVRDRAIVRPLLTPSAKDVAMTILQQMGGAGRIKAMTGAKNFAYFDERGSQGVSFDFPSRGKKPNYIKITLDPDDTYTVEFGKKKKISWKHLERVSEGGGEPKSEDFYTKVSEHKGAYAEDLKGLFEKETGLYLSLGTLGKGQFIILEKARSKGAKDKQPRKKRGYIKVRNPDPKGEPFIWVKPKKAEKGEGFVPKKREYGRGFLGARKDYLD